MRHRSDSGLWEGMREGTQEWSAFWIWALPCPEQHPQPWGSKVRGGGWQGLKQPANQRAHIARLWKRPGDAAFLHVHIFPYPSNYSEWASFSIALCLFYPDLKTHDYLFLPVDVIMKRLGSFLGQIAQKKLADEIAFVPLQFCETKKVLQQKNAFGKSEPVRKY